MNSSNRNSFVVSITILRFIYINLFLLLPVYLAFNGVVEAQPETNYEQQTTDKQSVTMSNQPKQRIQVPDSLRDILLEFSIAYLLEQPGDVVDYAVEFFTKLQETRKSKISQDDVPPSPDESIMSLDEGMYYIIFVSQSPLRISFFFLHILQMALTFLTESRYQFDSVQLKICMCNNTNTFYINKFL